MGYNKTKLKTCVRSLGNKKKKREDGSLGKKKVGENTARDQIIFCLYSKK